ncbi:hypothetical protein [Micromonospora thermarum]|uniref:Uncharacterized protein n=1 Tax=Micromonospora thermarum TaxID=2720024 RepID=A0ABX0ZD14_9ACTN|nr:hypothetical protein [Micromonospora thermarum]NJP35816.1 hypothetical protein [Micromonospora thermarum]
MTTSIATTTPPTAPAHPRRAARRPGRCPVSAQPAPKLTAARRRIYTALVAQPKQQWTVRTLTEALSEHASVNEGAVRDTVNLLLTHHLMELVPHQRTLTVALTKQGERTLTAALRHAPHKGGR